MICTLSQGVPSRPSTRRQRRRDPSFKPCKRRVRAFKLPSNRLHHWLLHLVLTYLQGPQRQQLPLRQGPRPLPLQQGPRPMPLRQGPRPLLRRHWPHRLRALGPIRHSPQSTLQMVARLRQSCRIRSWSRTNGGSWCVLIRRHLCAPTPLELHGHHASSLVEHQVSLCRAWSGHASTPEIASYTHACTFHTTEIVRSTKMHGSCTRRRSYRWTRRLPTAS